MTSASTCIDLQASIQRIFQLERQDLSCTYLAHQELESCLIVVIIDLDHGFTWLLASVTSVLQAVTAVGVSSCQRLSCFATSLSAVINLQCYKSCSKYPTPVRHAPILPSATLCWHMLCTHTTSLS